MLCEFFHWPTSPWIDSFICPWVSILSSPFLFYCLCCLWLAGGKVRSPTAVFGTFGQCSEAERYWGNAAFFQRGATQGHLPADLIALHCSTINSGLGCIDKQSAFLTHVQNGTRFRIANEIHQLLISWDSNLEIACSHIQTSLINMDVSGWKKTYPNSKIDVILSCSCCFREIIIFSKITRPS